MGANSDYSKAVEAYIAEGKSGSEAEALAFMDSVGDVIWAGAGGFISGAGMGTAFDTVQYHNNLVNEGTNTSKFSVNKYLEKVKFGLIYLQKSLKYSRI